jgi:maltooligosyltrehalose trehalohydrolase
MKHRRRMPFGAEIRLWAPRAQNLAVEVNSKSLPMPRSGWFELTMREASPGTRYEFTVDRRHKVPDPASRYQPSGLHGPTEVISPEEFEWQQRSWNGRPWEETILYELHLGTFSPEGTFAGAERVCRSIVTSPSLRQPTGPIPRIAGLRSAGVFGSATCAS